MYYIAQVYWPVIKTYQNARCYSREFMDEFISGLIPEYCKVVAIFKVTPKK